MTTLFATLPDPQIIEEISYEAILGALKTDAIARFAAAGVTYDLGNLETDPVMIVLQAVAFRDTLLRARINDAAKANLVKFAQGSDLDHLAGFYDVTRLVGELDEPLRDRVILAIQGRSPGGSEFHYESAAKRADVRIADVAAYRETDAPRLHIAVYSSDNGGVPDQAMLDAVTAEINKPEVRLLNDTDIVIEAAITQNAVDISADVWLLPDAPIEVFDALEQSLRDSWTAEAGIGFDLDPSWLTAKLHVSGVKKVVNLVPGAAVVAGPNEALALGTINLTMAGRDF